MISIVIPTYNRCALLRQTLEAISKQTIPLSDFEVLVIDNGSTDATADVAQAARAILPNLTYILESAPGLHNGRHRGMQASNGSILVYADDDIEPLPSWLSSIAESFRDENVAIVGGKDIPKFEAPPPPWLDQIWETTEHGRYLTYFSLIDLGDSVMKISPTLVFGCNFSIRKSVLQEIKGFHPDAMPGNKIEFRGDGETHVARMVESLGYTTIYHPGASVYHWVPASRMTVSYIIQRAYADGVTQSYTDLRSGKKPMNFRTRITQLNLLVRTFKKSRVHRQITRSFWKGYYFHQQQFSKNKKLQHWVLKENYL
jgi:glucosyl-dolichyl phosphate glucuronosyltransferase